METRPGVTADAANTGRSPEHYHYCKIKQSPWTPADTDARRERERAIQRARDREREARKQIKAAIM